MQISTERRRQNFSVWLRTGRWPRLGTSGGLEVKFNPWHDPDDGRFTFAGTGQYFGAGGSRPIGGGGRRARQVVYVVKPSMAPITNMGEADAWRNAELAKNGHKPGYREAIEEQYQKYREALGQLPPEQGASGSGGGSVGDGGASGSWASPQGEFRGGGGSFGGGGASGSWASPQGEFRGGGGSFGGAGASGNWSSRQGEFRGGGGDYGGAGASGRWGEAFSAPDLRPKSADRASEMPGRVIRAGKPTTTPRRSQTGSDGWSQISRNGYLYEIDDQNRLRRVSGELTLNPDQGRSQTAQRTAGGSDRRPSDQGGHYIARRFNGPKEAFNHFAQDANFNQSEYRKLEDEWARGLRAGKTVRVKIEPIYKGASQRPTALHVWFRIGSKKKSFRLPNEPKGFGDGRE